VRAYSRYIYERYTGGSARYSLLDRWGEDIYDFPQELIRQRSSHNFGNIVSLDMAGIFSTANFSSAFPNMTYGHFRNDATLLKFYENGDFLFVYFIKGRRFQGQSLFQKWTVGEAVETDTMLLPIMLEDMEDYY
jgi:hypothetical protein